MKVNTLPNWASLVGPIFGSEGEEGGEGNKPDEGGKPAGEGTGGDPKPNAEENKSPQLTEAQIAALVSDNEKNKALISGYEKDKLEREKAAEEAERATRSKEENLEKDVNRLTEENGQLKIVNERNLLELSIRKNDKYEWHDYNDVAALLDRTDIKIDASTGVVEGVDEALKALAKAKPHLLKSSEENESNGNNGNNGFKPGVPSGGRPNMSGDSSKKATKRNEMLNRFPVLNI